MTNCNIVRDLLPLYIDEVCSDESKRMVEEHLNNCGFCKQELKIQKESLVKENTRIYEKRALFNFSKKLKLKNRIKILLSTIIILLVIIIIGYLIYKPEFVVKYTEKLISAEIPVDEGIDIHVNELNYKNVYATYSMNEDNTCDVYIVVTQNLISKIIKDYDKSNNLIRISNNICVSYDDNSSKSLFILNENTTVKKIYYVNITPKTLMFLDDQQLQAITEKSLVWESE